MTTVSVLKERWDTNVAPLLREPDATWLQLATLYSEPHRHYHTLDHVAACLKWLNHYRHLAEDPLTMELALWAHDVIYDPRASDNEVRSADWFVEHFEDSTLTKHQKDRVHALILATIHPHPPTDADMALLQDIDLSILGADAGLYDRYEGWIRQEYAFVPEEAFRKGRGAVLKSFLDQGVIYHTPELREKLELPARDNLNRALAKLRG
ncbi:N-methyl-D-aspartate receptor NMDAR2C subunit [Alcanivorax sp. S6407]|uniref:HD domain-containing protein n=1 Tax=Alcanivorax sp. S6407 TaxID=2926424 RepID=UPI001FF109A6|nr:N-methyl-D-aspartate receptor NMDAR2C subunit [Alcanivorax sp. S6407]MCK0153353.1 N-methyl-D-aspartate receptor NMDAR2C subunit [Alcanivorax sp. S6407]